MQMAERWAPRAYAAALRAGCVLVGTTFAAHRLSQRLGADDDQTGYLEAVWAAAWPERAVVDDLVRSGLLATLAVALGLLIGLVSSRLRPRPGRPADVEPLTAAALGVAVPGLLWWPLAHLATGQGLVPDDPTVVDQGGLAAFRFLGFWALLAALALVPSVVAAARNHVDSPGGPIGALGRATMASRPIGPDRWRVGIPTLALGLALATVELLSGHRGLLSRFMAALDAGDAAEVMAVIVPIAIVGALVTLAASSPRSPEPAGSPTGHPTSTEPLDPRSPAVVTLGLLGSALVLGTLVALLLDPASSTETLAAPQIGGPWFGTDGEGRDVAALTLVALAPTLVAIALPAAGAALVGWGLTTARARQEPDSTGAILIDATVDLAWWPAGLLVPLAAVAVGLSDQPLLHPTVLLTTALLLVPLSTRLQARSASPDHSTAWVPVGATTLFLAALALAIHLVTSFVTTPLLAAPDGPLLLGQVGANGLDSYDDRPLALIGPLVVAAALGYALHLGAQVVAAQARTGRRSASPPDRSPAELDRSATLPGPVTTVRLDGRNGPAVAMGRPVTPPGPAEHLDRLDEPAVPAGSPLPTAGAGRPSLTPPGPPSASDAPAAPVPPTRPASEPGPDIRLLVTASTTIDYFPPSDDDPDSSSVLEEATRTIELRPSYFRPPPEQE